MRRLALLGLAALALAGCGGGDEGAMSPGAGTTTSTQAGGIVALDNVLALASDFRADEGKTRVLLVFSPT